MNNILIISADTVDSHMGGVGVRNWELAHALAPHCNVTLAVPNETDLRSQNVTVLPFQMQGGDLRAAASQAQVVITHGPVLHFHPYLREMDLPLAVDLYVPNLLESLVWHDQDDWEQWIPAYQEYLRLQLELLRAGDFFFCASERQRDYWLGWLHAQKRINPHTYRQDPTLRKLIDVVPFGLPAGSPVLRKHVLKGVHPGIALNDTLILWSGGLWDWLDPLSLIRAVARLAPRYPQLKLYFMGTRHPNPEVADMSMPARTIELSRELGLYDKAIFFGDWTPYQERENYLAEADLAVVSHPAHIETRFSFRTRVLDCIWAGLPLVATAGDAMADWVKDEHLGLVVPPGDERALADAIETILSQGGRAAYTSAFERLRNSLRWANTVQPLLEFCLAPALAPDKGQYLTDVERISRDKDAFLQQVIRDKDAFLEKVVAEKDAEFQKLLEQYHRSLPYRVYYGLKKLLGKA